MVQKQSIEVKVWDIFIRVFHWALVVFFIIAYTTEGEWITIHSYAGYTIFLLLIFRVIWGLIGTTHARFSNFISSPKSAIAYLKDEISGDAKQYLGHNPAGGLMVMALLVTLVITVVTGTAILATEGNGPLATTFVSSWSGALLEEVHEIFTTLVLLLVVTHVGGVIFSSLLQETNLVRAMVTGKKHKEIDFKEKE